MQGGSVGLQFAQVGENIGVQVRVNISGYGPRGYFLFYRLRGPEAWALLLACLVFVFGQEVELPLG